MSPAKKVIQSNTFCSLPLGRAGGESGSGLLFSSIYIAGTAVAIASAMVIAIVFNMILADIPPESNRSRMLYPVNVIMRDGDQSDGYRSGVSMLAIDECFRKMECVEAAAGILPKEAYRFMASDEQRQYDLPVCPMPCDFDFFRVFDLTFLNGRPFSEKEFRAGERVAMVSEMVMERLGNPASIILINGIPFRIVGVVKSVSTIMNESSADVYLPYTVGGLGFVADGEGEGGGVAYAGRLLVRILLRKGYSRQDFIDELTPLKQRYEAAATSALGERVQWVTKVETHFFHRLHFFSDVDDESLYYQARNLMPPALLMLFFLLLPALNLSGLVSNRMEERLPEMGIRKAFGAKRRTLLREVIHDNLRLTLCGGLVGWVLSWLFIIAIHNHPIFVEMFNGRVQSEIDMSLDLRMFFTPTLFLIVFLCCAVLNLMVALIPAWVSLKRPIVEAFNQKQ